LSPVTPLYLAVTLFAQAGCLLLLRLSQFGQNPFPELPLVTVLMFGALFVSPLLHLRRMEGARSPWVPALGVGLNLAFWAAFAPSGFFSPLYLLAPLAAILLAELYPLVFGKHAAMLAAMTVYVVCTLLANYTFDSFLPLPGYGLVNVGTLFFGVTFTQRDRVHRFGRGATYWMIFTAAVLNVLTALSLGTPLRYVAVGFAAIIISEAADTEVYQRFIRRRWLTRVTASNAVSIPLDTVIFTVFGFCGASFVTPSLMLEVILTDIAVKLIVGTLAALRILRAMRPLAETPA